MYLVSAIVPLSAKKTTAARERCVRNTLIAGPLRAVRLRKQRDRPLVVEHHNVRQARAAHRLAGNA
jgi:hypothetical protein